MHLYRSIIGKIAVLALLIGKAAAEPSKIPEVDALEVSVIVDNFYDCFQKEEKCAKRVNFPTGKSFEDIRLQGEMGLAYVITATMAGKKHIILFDFGLSQNVYQNNLKHLNVDISKAEALVLSHGHEDHYGGIPVALKQSHAPLYVGGSDAFLHRRFTAPTHSVDMGTLDRNFIEKNGTRIVLAPRTQLLAEVALTSGEIPHVTDYEKVSPLMKMEKDGTWVADPLSHEQALIFKIRDKGLVVVVSCAHAGVINTIEHAKKITGESRVLAVIGGIHLTAASEEIIDKTVAALEKIKPTFIAPMHCTGNRALSKLSTHLPEAYVHPSVGTRYVFQAEEVTKR